MAVNMRDDRRDAPRRGDGKSRKGLWILLALLVVAAIVVIGFFVLGGDADVDGEVDVDAPDVDVQVDETGDANVDAEGEEGGG